MIMNVVSCYHYGPIALWSYAVHAITMVLYPEQPIVVDLHV